VPGAAGRGWRRWTCLGALLPLVAALVAAGGCDEKLSDLTGPTPNLQPGFSSIQTEIFQRSDRTGCVSCHNAQFARFNGGLNLAGDAAYAALVNAPSRDKPGATRVVPGDPENSYLIHKLEGRSGIAGARMPQNGPPYLTDGQIAVVRRWIQQGAQQN
jgi:hypothetical protein